MDHAKLTIEPYDQIATDYRLITIQEHRAWLEDSMREFYSRLPGNRPFYGSALSSAWLI